MENDEITLANIYFKAFSITVADAELDKFMDELEKLCNKYGGDTVYFSWEIESYE